MLIALVPRRLRPPFVERAPVLMTNSFLPPCEAAETSIPSTVTWHNRYDGVVAIAWIGGRQVAGISGPWSGQFALTWWDRPLPARQLELFDSLEAAQAAVEAWALRMQHGRSLSRRASTRLERTHSARPGLAERLLGLWRGLARRRSAAELDHLRRLHASRDGDLADLHFAAYDESHASAGLR